tara:strand:- start:507 stop:941 length:435 start_codon:yes stop_codon:yes gene_type:complete
MKRAYLEWSSLFCILISAVCLILWSVSVLSVSDLPGLSFGKRRAFVQTFTQAGDVTLCDHVANLELIESVKAARLLEPVPSGVYGLNIPGFHFDLVRFDNASSVWSIRFSLLVPCVLLSLIGGFCFHRYRKVRIEKTKIAVSLV